MSFDPQAATTAYIDSLGVDALAKAAAYTAGNHWLLLWGLVVAAAVTWVVVRSGLLDRIARRLGRRGPNLRAFIVSAVFFVVSSFLYLPWTFYSEWWRERSYGRTSQPLGDFAGQELISVLILAVLGGLFFVGVYALIRRAGRVVPREALLSEAGRGDVSVGERTVDVHISHLRQKIGDDPRAPRRIKTVRGVGYVLVKEPQ